MSKPLLHSTIPALITPFKKSGEFDADAVPALVEYLIKGGATAFYICGSTGEGFDMTLDERKAMCVATVAAVAGRVPVVVHVGATGSTDTACELAKHAEEAGADATSAVPFVDGRVYKGGEGNDFDTAMVHFRAIGGACSLPFYIYWMAMGEDFTADDFLKSAGDIPNLAGMKFTSKNFYLFQQIVDVAAQQGVKLNMVTGPDEMNVAGKIMGSDGAIGSTYNIHLKTFVACQAAFDKGDVAEAYNQQKLANRVISLLIERCNCAKRGVYIVAGLKAWMRHRGLPAGYMRDGIMTEAEEAALITDLEKIGHSFD